MIKKFAAILLYKYKDILTKQIKLEVNINTMLIKLIKPIFIETVNPNKLEVALKTVSSK